MFGVKLSNRDKVIAHWRVFFFSFHLNIFVFLMGLMPVSYTVSVQTNIKAKISYDVENAP